MVAAHLESTGEKLFLLSESAAGASLNFMGKGWSRSFDGFDLGRLDDLVSLGLLQAGHGGNTRNFRVASEGELFCGWLMQEEGSAVEQIEAEIRRVTSGPEYAKAHPGAAHHLREAFELLWNGQTDDQVVSEVGDHLRKALMDMTNDVVGPDAPGLQEAPVERLRKHLEGLNLPSREAEVLSQVVELARVVLRLDHRLNHVRDESDKGEPDVSWDEIRRAAFTTAFACFELDRLRNLR